jgi:hypothetical protein
MSIKSPYINRAVQIAIESGNSIMEVSEGWSKVQQVVHMTGRLTMAVRDEIQRQVPSLRYWSVSGSPHNPAEEGFICDIYQIGLSFPICSRASSQCCG